MATCAAAGGFPLRRAGARNAGLNGKPNRKLLPQASLRKEIDDMTLNELMLGVRNRLLDSGDWGIGWSATADATVIMEAMERIGVLEAALDAAKRQPYLGIATNREIEAERACRRAMGHTDPEYRTWEGTRSDIDDTSKLSLRSAPETKGEPPTWEDLRGAAPDATGSLSSEAFVRQSRNEWGKETKGDSNGV